MVNLKTTNIVGSATETVWSQVQTMVYAEASQLMCVIQLKADDPETLVDLATLGSDILAAVEKEGEGLKSDKEIETFVKQLVSGIKHGVMIDILIARLVGEKLMIAGQGGVEVYLGRGGKLAKLSGDWNKQASVSGLLQDKDVLVWATTKFGEIVGIAKLAQTLSSDDNPAELLAPLVHSQTDSSGVGAIIGQVEGTEAVVAPSSDNWWQRIQNRKPKIKLEMDNPRKWNLWIGGVVFVLLILMIGIGMVRKVRQGEEAEYVNLENSVKAKLEETRIVGELSPDRARLLLSQAKGEVEAYLASEARETYKEKGRELLKDVQVADETTFKKNEIELKTIVELNILADGLVADKMKVDGKGNIVFVDNKSARVVSMHLVDRSRETVDVNSEDKLVDIGASATLSYGLTAKGVVAIDWKKKETKKVIESDEFWLKPTKIELFAGNVYVLDTEQSEIWKYPTLGDTFGARRRWLAVSIEPDLSNVIDMKVSGDIWLLTSTGKLERYSRGAPVNFSMEGFPATGEAKRFSGPKAVFATESLIYVLENGAARVVVFNDEGKYQSQYVNSEFAEASDLVINDDKGYVIVGNAVKEFGL